jgi:DNA-binding beta-propeller fold protein YncE
MPRKRPRGPVRRRGHRASRRPASGPGDPGRRGAPPTGTVLSLAEVGGRPAGHERGKARDPESGELRDVLFVTVESSAELHVLDVVESEFVPMADLRSSKSGRSVELSWKNFGGHDAVEVVREEASIGALAGDASSFVDPSPPEGVLDYEVVASSGACRSRLYCRAVLGPGEVIGGPVPFDGFWAMDIAEDSAEILWVTDSEGTIFAYTKELQLVGSIPSPFQGDDAETTGIAFNPVGDAGRGTLFVYNAPTNEVAETSLSGEILAAPFPSGVPSDPEDESYVPSMLYNPEGALGAGSFLYLDYTTGTLQERDRAGSLIRSCFHPEHVAEVPPEKSDLDAYVWGMSAVPGKGFETLSLPGGRVRDLRTARISRMSTATCELEGREIPLDGIAVEVGPIYLGIHETTHDGRQVAYILQSYPYQSSIMEIDPRPLPVPRLTDLQCLQESEEPNVQLSFRNPGGMDGVEVLRDGTVVGSLGGDASSFEDQGVPDGLRTYSARGVLGGVGGETSSCTLRVGTGSMAAREFAFPASWVHQVARDPVEGVYLVASTSNARSDFIYRFDSSLRFQGKVASPFKLPFQIAAMAVRHAGGKSETYALGWLPGASPGTLAEFPVRVADSSGRILRELKITPPRPRGNFLTYPSGMAWDGKSDSFWYLERNSATVVNISPDGTELSRFHHPAPIHQDEIRNYGLAIDAERGAIYLSGAGRLDYQVTKLVEVTRSGKATGVELPLDTDFYSRVWGFDFSPEKTGFVVAAAGGGIDDLVLYRAFSSLAPVTDLDCKADLASAALSWRNGDSYDGLLMYRDLEVAASLEGTATAWRDEDVDPRPGFYRVVGQKGGSASAGAICVPRFPRQFIRGDVEENGAINITDAIAILSYLFIGGRKPACLDAADTNDDGIVNITDPIALLGYLFLSSTAPASPFPQAGLDPTEDDLACYF